MKTKQAQTTQKIGRFYVSRALFDEIPYEIGKLLINFTVVRAEWLFHNGCIEYTALSQFFDDCPIGCLPPFYHLTFTRDASGVSRLDKVKKYAN